MAARDCHGVVVVRVSSGVIHRPDGNRNHGITETDYGEDWELFPSLDAATEAGYVPCRPCWWSYHRELGVSVGRDE